MTKYIEPLGSMDLVPQFDADKMNIAEAQAALNEHGTIVVHRGAGFAERIAGPFRELIDLKKPDKYVEGGFFPRNTKRLGNLVAKIPDEVVPLLTDPTSMSLCEASIGQNCEHFRVHAGPGGLIVGPGAEQQMLHHEDGAIWAYLSKALGQPIGMKRPTLVLASITACNEFSKANGGTLVVPGSHKWDVKRRAESHEIVSIAMPAGSTVYWLGNTLHAAHANTTEDDWREALFISWAVGWLRQETNHYLEIPFENVEEMDPASRAILGFSTSDTLGGYDARLSGAPRPAPYPSDTSADQYRNQNPPKP